MNKEQIYDTQIHPLMDQIIGICKTHHIALLATFALPSPEDAGLLCSTTLLDETGKLPCPLAEAASVIRGQAPLMITSRLVDGSKTMAVVVG